ncbi:hypothetical protein GobsT_25430 [Gemmata obscuriglobus]|uniref:Uncharacterized protein n=1 Tax=Gemmata obscuriglobus TaxID=114 RepID=A0A2Z3H4B1_9BACT|nr:hypothetical protein C1280_20735 [Gemmata obscuriglobus]QEG27779.1 hypothetical protein GobsT_25430 [Gemmata obscuriglobus]VTS05084.1 Uncharacterized protein OS=Mesorhizobium sp. STM 4661 GN=MESS4_p20003 PE=4 SV=1 [Gemmata obscuriglobus UQM 2246]
MFGPDQFHKRVAGDGASVTDRPTVKYVGVRTDTGVTVAREDDRGGIHPLAARTDLKNHSPAGFEWGYGGSGPAQLALAVLADALGAERALASYQKFKSRVVAKLARTTWELSRDEVVAWYRQLTAEPDSQPE